MYFTVKRIIMYYTGHNTPVYTCFLDASKAFDLVNQQLCIKWGSSTLRFFTISNGVRQGGILFPKIFATYMNGLTDELSNSYAGCYSNDKCINHSMYADDICLMEPTSTAMLNLLDVCHNYGAANNILFNPMKSVCFVYKPKYYK